MPIVIIPGAVQTLSTPTPPVIVSITPYNTALDVHWLAPLDDGGSPVVSYRVDAYLTYTQVGISDQYSDNYSGAAQDSLASTTTVLATSTAATLTGLINGTTYNVTVTAINAIGPSSPSSVLVGTPDASAGDPTSGGGGGGTTGGGGGGGIDTGGGTQQPPGFIPPASQPLLAAFPVGRVFRPENWLKTTEEATV